MPIGVVIADHQTLERDGIAVLLKTFRDIEVLGVADNGLDAAQLARESRPDVALVELYLQGLDGVATTRAIKRDSPEVEVVILSDSDDEQEILNAIQAGARGFILKTADIGDLANTIRRVAEGGIALSDEHLTKLLAGLSQTQEAPTEQWTKSPGISELTQRELEVLAYVAQGHSNKEIASILYLSENTVRAHVRSLMKKVTAANRTQLAIFGLKMGIGFQESASSHSHAGHGDDY